MGLPTELGRLIKKDFLDEIHHLLWDEPFENRGVMDSGWNCRDHAFVTLLLTTLMGFESLWAFGRATFIIGPRYGRPPYVLKQNPHSWVVLKNLGLVDLSPKSQGSDDESWPGIPIKTIVGDQWIPKGKGKLVIASNEFEYENAVARASHASHKYYAVYGSAKYFELSPLTVQNAFDHIHSPLTDRLRDMHLDDSIYSCIALHLFDLAAGRSETLTQWPRFEAIESLIKEYPDAIDRILDLTGV